MIVVPKIRGFICTTAHPVGCAQHLQEQIDYVRSHGPLEKGPKNVLVIGSSTGYGLASRVAAAFGCGAATIGVFFEKASDGRRTATAGYYNSVAFEQKALAEGIYAKSINGDAFSDEVKQQALDFIKKDLGSVDLVIYSLASPRRVHPKTGEIHKSVLKPIEGEYTNKSIDMDTRQLENVTLPAATQEEISQTISVMGGEDWEMWIDALEKENLLAEGAVTVAYSYIGPEVTRGVYRNGTIGKAKDHLENTAKRLAERLKKNKGSAYISVNKALVTQSSSAIPFIPLYFIILKKAMKEKNCEEDCIAQIDRLFREHLYAANGRQVEDGGFFRLDDYEMKEDIQAIVNERWSQLTQENLSDLTDLEGYRKDFLKLFGFGLDKVNYEDDVDIEISAPSLEVAS